MTDDTQLTAHGSQLTAHSSSPFLLLFLFAVPACSPAPPQPEPPPPVDIGYVAWLTQRPWALGDLPAVAASFDELCRRAKAGEEEAQGILPAASTSFWLARNVILPVLHVLPDAEDLPPEERLATRCSPVPGDALAQAVQEFVATIADPAHAVERLLAVEYQGAASHEADDARVARVVLAITLLFPLDQVGPNPALVAAVAALDPDGELLVAPAEVGGPCAAAPDDPVCLWERLAAQALMDSSSPAAVDRTRLTPVAHDTLARRGLLNLVARVVLPAAEDPTSTIRLLAAEIVARLSRALGVGLTDEGSGEGTTEGDWPEAAP
jgi:hypothetical protein